MAWINRLFIETLNMAVAASWLIVALLLLRPVLKRIAPKWLVCALWLLVAVRLVFPALPLHSDLSVYRLAGDAVQESGQVVYFNGFSDTDYTVVGYTPATLLPGGEVLLADDAPATPAATVSVSSARDYHQGLIAALWAFGVLVMLAVALVSYARVTDSVSVSVPLEKSVYLCDDISSPFILGVLRPCIYLASGMREKAQACVLRHERAHLRRGDHIWKPLGYLLLAVYWYDPLVWVAYLCFCRDMELACDERVIRTMAADERADYTQALLDCACRRRMVLACPLAFGEVGVKTRIKSVLNYKKPVFWAILAAIVVCAAVTVCFLTNPKATAEPDPFPKELTQSACFFGHYEQDGSVANGSESIQWRVLAQEDDRLLLVSQYALDFQSYTPLYESIDPVGWQDSSLRQWLNSEFLNAAFTPEEQQLIVDTEITPSDTEAIRDKVFLLTPEQVATYMPTAEDAMASPTHYAQTLLPDYNTEPDTATCTWWLLSSNNGHAGVVLQNGSTNAMRSYEPAYVRPAIWVQADAVESGLISQQQEAVVADVDGILPRPQNIRWSYDSSAVSVPYMSVNGGGTVFYVEIPDDLAERIRQRVVEHVTLSGFTAPQLTNGWGRDLISWSAEKAEVHLVFAEDYSQFYSLCRGDDSVWGLDTRDGVIQADGEVRELLAMIAALTGWETENGREAFSDLTMAELIYNGKTLYTVSDAQHLGSLQNLLQNGTQASFASKTPMERVQLRLTRSDGSTFSVLLDTDSPRIFLPPFYYYEYNDYESAGTKPLLDALGLETWPDEIGVEPESDASRAWLAALTDSLVPLPTAAQG